MYLFVLVSVTTTSCKKHLTGNPYIDRKVSVSQQQLRDQQKIIAKENKEYLEQLEKNKEDIRKNNDKFFEKKKQYKHITKNRRRAKNTKMSAQF